MDASSTLVPFLSSAEQVAEAQRTSNLFRDFLGLALKSSGADPRTVDIERARYRVSDRSGLRENLRIDDRVEAEGVWLSLRELLEPHLGVERERLVHSLWLLDSFDEVRGFLRALRCIVRYAHDLEGQLHGHLVLAETLLPMINSVEQRQYVLPNGDMASDAITRNLGVRAKVFALDRSGQKVNLMATGMFDKLSRTIGRFGR